MKYSFNQVWKNKLVIGASSPDTLRALIDKGKIKSDKEVGGKFARRWVDEEEIREYNHSKLKDITRHAIL